VTAGDRFEIPVRPRRYYPRAGGVEYQGDTTFTLTPAVDRSEPTLRDLVETVLAAGPYRFGDFIDLPMPLWLVRDGETSDTFRISVRDGTIRLHVLPATDSTGLEAFYDRVCRRSDCAWSVSRDVTEDR